MDHAYGERIVNAPVSREDFQTYLESVSRFLSEYLLSIQRDIENVDVLKARVVLANTERIQQLNSALCESAAKIEERPIKL